MTENQKIINSFWEVIPDNTTWEYLNKRIDITFIYNNKKYTINTCLGNYYSMNLDEYRRWLNKKAIKAVKMMENKTMTQRIFDVKNEKDMEDLWNILPESVNTITKATRIWLSNDQASFTTFAIKINWHDKKEIVRPVQEATEADIRKLCKFWNTEKTYIGKLCHIIETDVEKYYEMNAPMVGNLRFSHCRRLTKQEIEELC